MAKRGERVPEGKVARWLKGGGERVEAEEPLLEVSTDKVDTEIPSPVSGVLRGITVAEDETIPVAPELAAIDQDGSAAAPADWPTAPPALPAAAATLSPAPPPPAPSPPPAAPLPPPPL